MNSKHKTIVSLAMLMALQHCLFSANRQSIDSVLVHDNSAFALHLYQKLCTKKGNIFFSPYSISTALAMTYAGARGETAKQMVKAMQLSLSRKNLHSAFATLQNNLEKVRQKGHVQLYTANALWPQMKYPFTKSFWDLVGKNYKARITPVDYARQTEKARETINAWVEKKTMDKIENLIKPGILTKLTRLVLTNAIYFKGEWASRFNKKSTSKMPFKLSLDKAVQTSMMYQKGEFGYWAGEDLQVLRMPYVGNQISMIVLLPKKIDGLSRLENKLNVENLKKWTSRLRNKKVDTHFPKFKLECDFRLKTKFQAMGMVDAFTQNADFSGMDGTKWLYISAVLHKAFVEVNEKGTEAAAATAVVMTRACEIMVPLFRADHPFIFLIQENQTKSILFIGRMTNPTKSGE